MEKIKVLKQTVITKEETINLKGITLLSQEEYEANRDIIPRRYEKYWLRTAAPIDYLVFIVNWLGKLDRLNVDADLGVRPALLCNLESSSLNRGDKVIIAGYTWTVLSNNLIHCDDIIGEACFREESEASDSNDYKASDIKKWLERWYSDVLKTS